MSEREEWGVATGNDGALRCWWCLGAPEYVDYHDSEWGRPTHADNELFELLTLESFQSGLSWLTILRKREGFRSAFSGFEIECVADFDETDVDRLLGDAGIVRHRGKIEAAINNARAACRLQKENRSLDELLWSFAPPEPEPPPVDGHALAASTPASTAMAKELRRLGFRFFGPTTAYSFMQAAGIVNDHLADCAFRG